MDKTDEISTQGIVKFIQAKRKLLRHFQDLNSSMIDEWVRDEIQEGVNDIANMVMEKEKEGDLSKSAISKPDWSKDNLNHM